MGAFKFLSALQQKVDTRELIEKGLMFVDATINSRPSKSTLIDSGETHNFIADHKARRLGLTIEKDLEKMKVVYSKALPIVGISKRVTFKLGAWTGELDFVVVRMNDFNVVLEMGFLLEHKVNPMPLAKCLVITDHNPTIIPASIKQPGNLRMISVIQLKRGLTQDEPTFMAIPLIEEVTTEESIPSEIKEVLESYFNIMPESLPQALPPRQGIDHEIKLLPGVKPPVKNTYWMALPEQAELRKQLDELLTAGFICLAKAPYGDPVLFQKKKDMTLRLCIDYRALM
ncbi:uncharacterized protein LOC111488689 [Cucurbita maxima]|uniref:Uncharacterized protein LOC111488689 n=1 Tax=Cucurbita maxima TaxID=3661 RepID=A0A6J1JPK8_CUCMA|nr:uncharacterized protein LOC111488689 [Cucurbita maxima]